MKTTKKPVGSTKKTERPDRSPKDAKPAKTAIAAMWQMPSLRYSYETFHRKTYIIQK